MNGMCESRYGEVWLPVVGSRVDRGDDKCATIVTG